jgi:hypothetical protein
VYNAYGKSGSRISSSEGFMAMSDQFVIEARVLSEMLLVDAYRAEMAAEAGSVDFGYDRSAYASMMAQIGRVLGELSKARLFDA